MNVTPQFKSILVSVTEGCHVGCIHCGFLGSTRERETDRHEIEEWVTQACQYGIDTIIFTGGEPFERFEVLRAGIEAAKRQNASSAVFTSSFWAETPAVTEDALRSLDGLDHVYLSTDIYHQKRVPYIKVRHVVDAAIRLGLREISLVITYARVEDLEAVKQHYLDYGDSVRFVEERVIPTPFIPRAIKDQDPLIPATAGNYSESCWLDTPIINPNGDIFACHVGKAGAHDRLEEIPYFLGNLREETFEGIMRRSANRADYQFLRTHGPKGVAALFDKDQTMREKLGRDAFSGPCDLCFSTLSTPAGREALYDYVMQPEVLTSINFRLALVYGEAPLDAATVSVGPRERQPL